MVLMLAKYCHARGFHVFIDFGKFGVRGSYGHTHELDIEGIEQGQDPSPSFSIAISKLIIVQFFLYINMMT